MKSINIILYILASGYKMALTLEKYTDSLAEAIKANDLKSVENILKQEITNNDEERLKFLEIRKSACLQCLREKSLPFVKLLFSKDLVFKDSNLIVDANIELLNSAIESDFVNGIKFLHYNGLVFECLDSFTTKWNALMQSVELGKVGVTKYLLAISDINLNPDPYGMTILALAASTCNLQILRLLLVSKANLHINDLCRKSDLSLTPLQWCFENDHADDLIDCVKILLEAGADINIEESDREKRTAFLMAAQLHFPSIVTLMLDNGADVNKSDSKQNTVLHYICQNPETTESLECIKRLIHDSSDINIKNSSNESPFFIAVTSDNQVTVEKLVAAGCDVNVKCLENNEPPLSAAILMKATLENESQMTKTLLKAGCDVNAANNEGMSPLMHAVFYRDVDLVKLLIEYGANVNACDNMGTGATACDYCFEYDQIYLSSAKDVLKILFAAGVDKPMDRIGADILDRAMWHGDFQAVKYLITEELDIHNLGKHNQNILHYAAKCETFLKFETLFDGVDINHRDDDGDPPIMVAAECDNIQFIEYMIKKGCDVNVVNNKNQTAMMIVATDNDIKTLEKLLNAGCDVNLQAKDGRTAIQFLEAEELSSYITCLKLLLLHGGAPSIEHCDINGFKPLQHVLDTKEFSLIWYLVTHNCSLVNLSAAESEFPDIFDFYRTKHVYKTVLTFYESGATREALLEHLDSRKERKFHKVCNNMSLKSLCRREIRRAIGPRLHNIILKLKLPQTLQDFVLLKDIIPAKYFDLKLTEDNDEDDEDSTEDEGDDDDDDADNYIL